MGIDIGFSPVDLAKSTVGNTVAVPLAVVGAEGVAQDVSTGKVHDLLIIQDDNPRDSKVEAAARLAGMGDAVGEVKGVYGDAKEKLEGVLGDLPENKDELLSSLSSLGFDGDGGVPGGIAGVLDKVKGSELGSALQGSLGAQRDPLPASLEGAKEMFGVEDLGDAKDLMQGLVSESSPLHGMLEKAGVPGDVMKAVSGPEMGG